MTGKITNTQELAEIDRAKEIMDAMRATKIYSFCEKNIILCIRR